jgi:hypothetical protein
MPAHNTQQRRDTFFLKTNSGGKGNKGIDFFSMRGYYGSACLPVGRLLVSLPCCYARTQHTAKA